MAIGNRVRDDSPGSYRFGVFGIFRGRAPAQKRIVVEQNTEEVNET
jgi:hypothetical protein